jgi:hypothetical protein
MMKALQELCQIPLYKDANNLKKHFSWSHKWMSQSWIFF